MIFTGKSFLTLALCIASVASYSQSSETVGWFFWSHSQKLTGKTKVYSDLQFRSANNGKYLETLLFRPGMAFEIKKDHQAVFGYTYFANWTELGESKMFELEHRIWEQYQIDVKILFIEITNRLRLEQRFLPENKFSQRIRHYFKSQIPFKRETEFKVGLYGVIQNELFLNIQNRKNVNNKFLDQNRIYAGLGYRFSQKVETEIGYMFRYQLLENSLRLHTNVIQLSLSTDL